MDRMNIIRICKFLNLGEVLVAVRSSEREISYLLNGWEVGHVQNPRRDAVSRVLGEN
jgi:hypothetical protein